MGVFQGSALGPLLFSVFANDLSLYADGATVVQYADDTQVMVTGKKSGLPIRRSFPAWRNLLHLWTDGLAPTPLRSTLLKQS